MRKKINKKKQEREKYLKDIIEKRYIVLIVIILLLFAIIVFRLFSLQILDKKEYEDKLVSATEKTVSSTSAPRGRIYDRNYNLLVDNEAIKTIYYK